MAPDVTYRDELSVEAGGTAIRLIHARGETDDHTWAWLPEQRVACVGDLFIWNFPNAGNPQKVQRYPEDWARRAALDHRAPSRSCCCRPTACRSPGVSASPASSTSPPPRWSRSSRDVLAMMNGGSSLDEIIHTVRVDDAVLQLPYMRPLYDEPEFVDPQHVASLRRVVGRRPGEPQAGARAALAAELASLAGGAGPARRTGAWSSPTPATSAWPATSSSWRRRRRPDDPGVHAIRADLYERRRHTETSLMTKGIFAATVRESRAVSEPGS